MTTDETMREIQQLLTAVDREAPTRSVVLTVYGDRCTSATHGSYSAHAKTCTAALDALRGELRAAASEALAVHEAKAETLRKALGVPSPAMAVDDLRAAVREWWAARREVDVAVTRDVAEASEAITRLEYAEDTLRDAMGGEL